MLDDPAVPSGPRTGGTDVDLLGPPALVRHLQASLGAWPPPGSGVHVTSCERRHRPGWDGTVRSVAGLMTPAGAILSVPVELVAPARELMAAVPRDQLLEQGPALGRLLGRSDAVLWAGPFRWTTHPAELPRPGTWMAVDDPRLPEWLLPFRGPALVALDPVGRTVLAGVGIKRHDDDGHELAVVTNAESRGRGLAAQLIAQAAQAVLDGGAVPTYQHAPGNEASARTAERSGFPDRGWRALVLAH